MSISLDLGISADAIPEKIGFIAFIGPFVEREGPAKSPIRRVIGEEERVLEWFVMPRENVDIMRYISARSEKHHLSRMDGI